MNKDLFSRIGEVFGAAYSKSGAFGAQPISCDEYISMPRGVRRSELPIEEATIVEEEYDYIDSPSFGNA